MDSSYTFLSIASIQTLHIMNPGNTYPSVKLKIKNGRAMAIRKKIDCMTGRLKAYPNSRT